MFTLSVLGLIRDHKACPGIVDFSHLPEPRLVGPTMLVGVERVVVLGRGAAGKTTAAAQLGQLTGIPVLELDQHFWSADLTPMPPHAWAEVQHQRAAGHRWIMDGDLGPYDVLAPRLTRADTVLILDFGLMRCAWRAVRRSRERADFWRWLLIWRYRYRPALLRAVATHARGAEVHVIRSPRQLRGLLRHLHQTGRDQPR